MKIKPFSNRMMWPLFDFVERTKGIKQLEEYHPEKDVFTHSVQSLRIALRETNDTDLILAAMLHDIGKYKKSIGHVKVALEYLDDIVSVKTLWLIENHMRVWAFIEGEMRKLGKIFGLVNHPWFPELVHLARIDKKARNPSWKVELDRKGVIKGLNRKAEKHFLDFE